VFCHCFQLIWAWNATVEITESERSPENEFKVAKGNWWRIRHGSPLFDLWPDYPSSQVLATDSLDCDNGGSVERRSLHCWYSSRGCENRRDSSAFHIRRLKCAKNRTYHPHQGKSHSARAKIIEGFSSELSHAIFIWTSVFRPGGPHHHSLYRWCHSILRA